MSVESYASSTENIFKPNRACSGLERTLLGPDWNAYFIKTIRQIKNEFLRERKWIIFRFEGAGCEGVGEGERHTSSTHHTAIQLVRRRFQMKHVLYMNTFVRECVISSIFLFWSNCCTISKEDKTSLCSLFWKKGSSKQKMFVCLFVSLSVCPTNQEAAFLNKRGNADLRSETDWG